MTYPPPGGTPDPYQPPQPYGQSSDPTAPYQQDPYAPPASGAPSSSQPYGGQPYGPPPAGQPYAQPYGPPAGQPYAQSYGNQPYGPGHPTATGTNVLAILALVFAFIFSPAAILLGHLAKRQIRQTGEQGAGLATWGLWLGYIFTGLGLVLCALWVALVAAGVASGGEGTTTF